MVVRGEDTKKVFIDEIAMLIIENPAVSFTGCLISALVEKKIKVVFCDEKRSPVAELIPHHGCHDSSAKIKAQVNWSSDIKGAVWTEIVAEKIRKQAEFLSDLEKYDEMSLLNEYISQLEFCDMTNREGHAAKVYFNAVFGMDFTRSAENTTNAALNYGYSLILSAVNREVSANGYLTQIGIFHDNMFNHFNLSCDLMEPYRVFIDRFVKESKNISFGTEEKREMVALLNRYMVIEGTRQTVLNSIKIYVKSVFDALNDEDVSKIKFMQYEL